ncbi:MAG TPA: NAD-dependent epimerase/dehydratase family protein [Polyangia bacterium]|nr:NAD-dependent epimerase/dehydratase family protein [Polyangia bacterium]
MSPRAGSDGRRKDRQTVLVTGGSGFLGRWVVDELCEAGHRVRVLGRGKSAALAERGVEIAVGDVSRDLDGAEPLQRAFDGVSALFHLAGFVSRDPDDGQRMMRVHIDGTRRVLEAAKQAGVRRVVLASTSGTIAVSRQAEILDERAPYPTEIVGNWPYYLSKIYQEKLALDLGATLGLEVVIVNPSLLLGPGDERNSSTGDVRRFLKREIPVVPDGGVSFVDARDAAKATVAALEEGRAGERYLLGGPNWTVSEYFGRLERASKVRAPRLKLPNALQRRAASLLEQAYKALDKEPPVERISVEMAQVYWWCDSSKAERELGFQARDPGETLDDTIRDLRTRMI